MPEPTVVTTEPTTLAAIRQTIAMADIRTFFDQNFGKLAQVMGEQGVLPSGPAVGVYWGIPTDTVDLAVGFPTAMPIEPTDSVAALDLPACRAVQVVHEGNFDGLSDAYRALHAWAQEQDLTPGDLMWEAYLTEPAAGANPDDMRTLLTWTLVD